jgi:hypothetical protein
MDASSPSGAKNGIPIFDAQKGSQVANMENAYIM